MRRRGPGGPEMSPEDIFNAFFGGGMPGGMNGMPGGMHFYSTGFGGPGVHFRAGGPRQRQRGPQQQQQQEQQPPGLGVLLQLLPLLVIMLLSFFAPSDPFVSTTMPGENQFFSLVVSSGVIALMDWIDDRWHHVVLVPIVSTCDFMSTEQAALYKSNAYKTQQSERNTFLCFGQIFANICTRSFTAFQSGAHGRACVRKLPGKRVLGSKGIQKTTKQHCAKGTKRRTKATKSESSARV